MSAFPIPAWLLIPSVGEEEVKYRVGENGLISQISKEVVNALGEAVGVNKVLLKGSACANKKLASSAVIWITLKRL